MPSPLLEFTQALWAGGELVLSTNDVPQADDVKRSLSFLFEVERDYRRTLPREMPAISPVSAEWALTRLYRASQFLLYRELSEELLRTDLGKPCPELKTAATCYSVDLSFRFLPDLMRMARAANTHDPLVEVLRTWANDWPLSSVGIPELQICRVDSLHEISGLRTLYIDRIISTNDLSRLNDPQVIEGVQTALGGFRELAPAMYDAAHRSGE